MSSSTRRALKSSKRVKVNENSVEIPEKTEQDATEGSNIATTPAPEPMVNADQ